MSQNDHEKTTSEKNPRLRVLTFADYYIPGYKAGGPIKTILNMVNALKDTIDFKIVTRDRDFGEAKAYENITPNKWNTIGNADVLFVPPDKLTILNIGKIIKDTKHDILYLNSFFSTRATAFPLLARALRLCPKQPVILATRGEFSPGALKLKSKKKSIYIRATRVLGIYRNITWQASSELEKKDIKNAVKGTAKSIAIAPDLLDPNRSNDTQPKKRVADHLKIIFLSRISKKKNLHYLLTALQGVPTKISVNIYGPREDIEYWKICEEMILKLPPNIEITYKGTLTPDEVHSAFEQHDLFVFPTMGENFGHVIFESLNAGTAVITSDKVPWKEDGTKALQLIPLDCMDRYTASITEWADCSNAVLFERRKAALAYAENYQNKGQDRAQNASMFSNAAHLTS